MVEFVRFVRSVEGRLVTRWDAPPACIGARIASAEERKAGAPPIVWDTQVVVPLTAQFCARYDRELRQAIVGGDLVECSRDDWGAWLKLEKQREADRVASVVAAQLALEPTAPAEPEPDPQPEAPATATGTRSKRKTKPGTAGENQE